LQIGSPEECAEQITDLMRATGCNRLVVRVQWVGMEHPHVMRTIELLGDKGKAISVMFYSALPATWSWSTLRQ
jgi:alkanesulfonate monooxygenase SsuD/methylene tetrahydromethanopterin reductase-like flavin-dependent oxidoreductase (luciferase family)